MYFNCIYGDRGRYQQFLLNFISNSLKFTENGGQVTVQVKLNKLRKSKSENRTSGVSNSQFSKAAYESGKMSPFKNSMGDFSK